MTSTANRTLSGVVRAIRAPIGGVSDVWRADHPWATIYDAVVEHERVARVGWGLGIGSDVRLLYRAADEIGRLPAGSAVLDIPCGGGVALRGLSPGQDIRYVAADISPAMLERTAASAQRRGLDQVETVEADVGALQFDDGTFDLCVSFTGLHCFPDPARAVKEIARVLRSGGVLTGSAFLNDTGIRFEPMRALGRRSGLLGPSGTRAQLRSWLASAGFEDVALHQSGGIVYFRAVRS
jgi:SAM-dependent methyltransferase